MKKTISTILVVLLLAVIVVALKLFVIGTPADSASMMIHVEEGDGQLTVYMQCMDSAMAISDIKYQYNGTVLHMTAWRVLCSSLHDSGERCLYYELTDETEIWLNNKLIWTK